MNKAIWVLLILVLHTFDEGFGSGIHQHLSPKLKIHNHPCQAQVLRVKFSITQ